VAYLVRYRYHHRGQSFTREASVDLETFQQWTKGTQLRIRYLPDHPQTAELEAMDISIAGAVVRTALYVLLMGIVIGFGVVLSQQ
jgi:hypothetical protein